MDRKLSKTIEALTADERKLIKDKLAKIVNEINKYKNSYFWSPSSIAVLRRRNEFEHNETIQLGSYEITFTSSYRESCHNCYYRKELCLNGKKTNTTRLNNIITKIEELEKAEE